MRIQGSMHLLDSLALTPRPEFATNEETGGDTGLTLPRGSIEGVFETVVVHRGCYREGNSDGAGKSPNDMGLYAYLQEPDLKTGRPRGERLPKLKYAVNATPTCHGSL